MIRTYLVVPGMILLTFGRVAHTAEPGTLLAEGPWSKAVATGDGDALRGRLVLYEHAVTVGGRAHFPRQQRRGVSVYVELQNARDAVGPAVRVYCDFVNGLQCALVDKDGKAIPPAADAFSGGVPQPEWVTLPCESTIRVRSSPFGLHRENAVVISPTRHGGWVIDDGDMKEYFLSGTFTADKTVGETHGGPERVWSGRLELPAVRIGGASAPDPVVALVATLEASHGLWVNGTYPKLDSPADATAEQVLPEVFEKMSPPEGKITKFDVIEERMVTIQIVPDRKMGAQERYIAARVRTNVGEKIVLMQRSDMGWWSRIYDTK